MRSTGQHLAVCLSLPGSIRAAIRRRTRSRDAPPPTAIPAIRSWNLGHSRSAVAAALATAAAKSAASTGPSCSAGGDSFDALYRFAWPIPDLAILRDHSFDGDPERRDADGERHLGGALERPVVPRSHVRAGEDEQQARHEGAYEDPGF